MGLFEVFSAKDVPIYIPVSPEARKIDGFLRRTSQRDEDILCVCRGEAAWVCGERRNFTLPQLHYASLLLYLPEVKIPLLWREYGRLLFPLWLSLWYRGRTFG